MLLSFFWYIHITTGVHTLVHSDNDMKPDMLQQAVHVVTSSLKHDC